MSKLLLQSLQRNFQTGVIQRLECKGIKQLTPTRCPPLAFVFDIDGVLLRGDAAIPGAKAALLALEGNNVFRTKIPYILLTNGGGVSEQYRSELLSKQLGLYIDPSYYIQAHTVLESFSHKHRDEHVLVLGGRGDAVRLVAQSYGFKNVYTTLDVLAWKASVWPFYSLTREESLTAKATDFSKIRISSIFVFHDPRNWGLDIQILLDVIQSGGVIGSDYLSFEDQIAKPVQLTFCNPDLLWRSDFTNPRMGQGAFREAFLAIYKSLTGYIYPYTQLGKPTKTTHSFAESRLFEQLPNTVLALPRRKIYMIGDNPESDILGANTIGWSSILVHTGVYDPKGGAPRHSPTSQAYDVQEAVHWAMAREADLDM